MIFSKEELSRVFKRDVPSGINGISINSREINQGDLFIALKGDRVDAHDFIDDALDRGAVLALSEKHIEGDRVIHVESCMQSLIDLAKYNIDRTAARHVCVTGSVGKTTTKKMIAHILSHQTKLNGAVYSTKKNFNSQIGLPLCASLMPANTQIGVYEMGMSEHGHIRKLIDIVRPDVAVITKICEAHLQFFQSPWDIAKAKAEIFERATDAFSYAIIPADSPYSLFLEKKAYQFGAQRVIKFGNGIKTDARILSKEYNGEYFTISAAVLGYTLQYRLYSHEESYIDNTLPALLAAYFSSGISVENLALGFESFRSDERSVNILIDHLDLLLVNDTYNACPASVKAAIKSLSKYNNRRKVVIIGDMLELGVDQNKYHENLAATIDKYGIDLVCCCGESSKYLFNNISPKKQGVWCLNSETLSEQVKDVIQYGDCVLVKGSRSMQMEKIVESIRNMGRDVL